MAKKKIDINKITQEEGTIQVTRTSVLSGKETDQEVEIEKITVRPFLCQPAYVSVKVGETVPLAQLYAGRRIDVNVSYPCYKEEMPQILREVTDFVKDYLDKEVSMIEGAAIPKVYKEKTQKQEPKQKSRIEAEAEEIEEDESPDIEDEVFPKEEQEKPEPKTRTRRKKDADAASKKKATSKPKTKAKDDLSKKDQEDLDDLFAELDDNQNEESSNVDDVEDTVNDDEPDDDDEDLLADIL